MKLVRSLTPLSVPGLPDGLKYHIFFTYNPPRSLSSWVNVKYNTSLISNDTYVHHSTVNDNPYISKQLRDNLIELQAKKVPSGMVGVPR